MRPGSMDELPLISTAIRGRLIHHHCQFGFARASFLTALAAVASKSSSLAHSGVMVTVFRNNGGSAHRGTEPAMDRPPTGRTRIETGAAPGQRRKRCRGDRRSTAPCHTVFHRAGNESHPPL